MSHGKLDDRSIDAYIDEISSTPEERELLLEAHRQLEKDLLRLADPLPPFDFVEQVMARVAVAPAAVISRSEFVTAMTIVSVALLGGLGAIVISGDIASTFALGLARTTLLVREHLVAASSGLSALWRTAAIPFVCGMGMMMIVTLSVLRRITAPTGAKASL